MYMQLRHLPLLRGCRSLAWPPAAEVHDHPQRFLAAADPCRRGARRPAGRYHTYPGASAAGSPPLPPRVAAAAALPLRAPTWAHLRSQPVHMHVPRTTGILLLACYGLLLFVFLASVRSPRTTRSNVSTRTRWCEGARHCSVFRCRHPERMARWWSDRSPSACCRQGFGAGTAEGQALSSSESRPAACCKFFEK